MPREPELERKGILLCLSGPSGVGKGTVIAAVKGKTLTLDHSISITTRAPRGTEQDGVDYYFRTKQEFEALLGEGEILEHDSYLDNYYGTPRQPIIDKLEAGRDVIMDVTVPGSLETIRNFPAAVGVFLLPPSFTELRHRLVTRGTETPEAIERRMQKSRHEVREARRFKYILVNYEVEKTADLILSILDAERHLAPNLAGIEELILNR